MNMKTHTCSRTWILVVVLLVVAAGVLYWMNSDSYRQWKMDRQGEAYIKQVEDAQRADTYGGATPEETMALFTAAIQKGDVELAAKYFELDAQDKMLAVLLEQKTRDKLIPFLKNLQALTVSRRAQTEVFWSSGLGASYSQMVMRINSINQKWKIVGF